MPPLAIQGPDGRQVDHLGADTLGVQRKARCHRLVNRRTHGEDGDILAGLQTIFFDRLDRAERHLVVVGIDDVHIGMGLQQVLQGEAGGDVLAGGAVTACRGPLQAAVAIVQRDRDTVELGLGHVVGVFDLQQTNHALVELFDLLAQRIDHHHIALRDRPDDILPLARHFLEHAATELNVDRPDVPKAVAQRLRMYAWPGNIRELENTIERAVILCLDEQISVQHLPAQVQQALQDTESHPFAIRPGLSLKDMEKELILSTLRQTDNNRTRAAEILGITRQTLQNKLREYDLN